MSMTQTHRIVITPTSVVLDGTAIATDSHGESMLTELYRHHVNDYPKFFKMDMLCRLGFVASELLLKAEGAGLRDTDERAVVLFNRYASIHNDSNYQQTISTDNYFPSPALFVYTLPNIVTGEICIRNKYYGESSFYVLKDNNQDNDDDAMAMMIESCFADNATQSALAGWLEYMPSGDFLADLRIYIRGEAHI